MDSAESTEQDGSMLVKEQNFRWFSYAEMQSATHSFDDALILGRGRLGKVYKGSININNRPITVAIKRLNLMLKEGGIKFWNEMKMLSKFRHVNLVSLIGCCNDSLEWIIVYQYIPCGTLADHFSQNNDGNNSPLSWEQRLTICVGAARGLDYLHKKVIHGDVKSSNILLDDNWVAKICTTNLVIDAKGTLGYLDPEYFITKTLTRKSDVYSFGIVLLEVLWGRVVVDWRLRWDQHLVKYAQRCIEEGKIDDIIDTNLRGKFLPNSLLSFVQIATQCLHIEAIKRPTMAEVVVDLELAMAIEGVCEL